MLITKNIEVDVSSNVSHYEEKGYQIPKHKDKQGQYRVKRGTKIIVNVNDLPRSSGLQVEYECTSCKNIFSTRYHRYLNNKHGLCRACSFKRVATDKEIIKKKSGENHPRYNKNLTDEEREKGRHYPEYVEWRKSVYDECSYTCQVCGDDRGGNLIAHHLNGWHWNKRERFATFNGITVCKSCHDKFHRQYGFENNTRDQFTDFLLDAISKRENRSEASKVFDLL